MNLLNKLEFLRLLSDGEKIDVTEQQATDALEYAQGVWTKLQLKPRALKPKDIAVTYRHGDHVLNHIKVYPRKCPETFVIVIGPLSGTPDRHILIDLAAEYAEPTFEAPTLGFMGAVTKRDIKRMIPQVNADEDNPFAVVEMAAGTYMQTLSVDDGYLLEYQLVNTSSHYEVPEVVTAEQVVAAMTSYAFGKNEWLEMFDWQPMEL